jgi:protein-L-isoaspartate(D-aspartate) O-methyltransferase
MPMMAAFRGVIAGALATAAVASPAHADDHAANRQAMVAEILADYRAYGSAADPFVIEAMGRVARHEFVPPQLATSAYENRPLPIGEGQTISQPYIVALMTDLARARKGSRVLEVGTGSGYQAAILAEMGAIVFTIEIVPALARTARARLARLGYRDVEVVTGDGYEGMPSRAPFDAILVTAGASHVPPALVRQLAPGGRMVIPVGDPLALQHLMVVEKAGDGSVSARRVLPVRFVPLTREGGVPR